LEHLPLMACKGTFSRWPQDVGGLKREYLVQLQQAGVAVWALHAVGWLGVPGPQPSWFRQGFSREA
jgi:NO-binding membrane sensor protein with MHYT domain